MKQILLTGAFTLISSSCASYVAQPIVVSNKSRIAASTLKSTEITGMTCTAISEYHPPGLDPMVCSNVFVDSNDIEAPDDGSYAWAADNEGASDKLGGCVGIWIELTLPAVYTVDIVTIRQRYSPSNQGDKMDVALKSISGVVLSTQSITFSNVVQNNPLEEAISLTPTAGVKSVRFTYSQANTADCSSTGGFLGAKRIKVYGHADPPTTNTGAGAAGAGFAVGDPHLQNIYGQRFDLMISGWHTLVNIPRGQQPEHALLLVRAQASRLNDNCADTYFTALNITGSWTSTQQAGGYHYVPESVPHDGTKWVAVGKIRLKVVKGRTESGIQYLNFYIKHLGQAGFAVGGLLGQDDHGYASTPPEACLRRLSLSGDRSPRTGQTSSQSHSVALAAFA